MPILIMLFIFAIFLAFGNIEVKRIKANACIDLGGLRLKQDEQIVLNLA